MADGPSRTAFHTSILLCILWLTMHPTHAAQINLDELMLSTEAPDINDVSPLCLYELQELQNDSGKLVPVLDSFGKPASGILAGNLAWLGHFDQCMGLQSFRHCLVGMSANISELLNTSTVLPIQWGVCAPEVCNETDVRNSLEILLDILNVPWLTITNLQGSAVFCTEKPNTNFDTGFILTCILISSLVALTLVGSIVDYFLKRSSQAHNSTPSENCNTAANGGHGFTPQIDSENKTNSPNGLTEKTPLLISVITPSSTTMLSVDVKHTTKPNFLVRLLLCFAMTRNLPKLLGTRKAEGSIPSLNGIRVISISWVILGHTLVNLSPTQTNENILSAFDRWLNSFPFQAISNAYFSVDTFFFLSGLLLSFLTLKKMKETGGKIPWLWFYIHRYIRLTPTLALLILWLIFIQPNLNQGPEWFRFDRIVNLCKSRWWENLLYIDNFVHGGDPNDDCLSWGWYLANDMQFFIISPLFILPLFWYPVFGIIALAVTCVVSFIITSILVYQNDFQPGVLLSGAVTSGTRTNPDFQKLIYVKPYCRIPPYLVGMAMGYCFYKIESGRRSVKLSPVIAAGGWAIAAGLGVAVIFGLYDVNRGASTPTVATSMAYNSLSAFTWAIALSWVVFACQYGYGGFINDFLTWSFWVPLSRLTYCVYLFHPLVTKLFGYAQTEPYHWSAVYIIYMFASFLVIAHCLALLVTLILEFPVGNLEKMLREALTRKKRDKCQNDSKPNNSTH